MKKFLFLLLAGLSVLGVKAQDIVCGPYEFPSFRTEDTLAAKGWPEDTFTIKTDFPKEEVTAPEGGFPWEKIDFARKPMDWANTVLDYCWAGNEEVGFRVEKNEQRNWYHVPNLHYGRQGRDFIHGLISARSSMPKELHPKQGRKVRNFSIGFYNDPGAYTLGQVYCNPSMPDEEAANFPVGTVFFRLNFTSADTSQVPFLKNSMEWMAFVNTDISDPKADRVPSPVRLIQVDVAVRSDDPKAETGWVMSTFVYDGNKEGETVRERLVPVGVQWGNDPTVSDSAVITKKMTIKESWINPDVYNKDDLDNSLVQHLGWGGRLAGPIDDPNLSLLSSHMPVSWPPVAKAYPPSDINQDSTRWWFRNMPRGKAFAAGSRPLDFAFELGLGIREFYMSIGREDIPVIWRGDVEDWLEMSGENEEENLIVLDGVVEEGLVGRKLVIFIIFIVAVVLLGGLLAYNLLSTPK